MNLRINPNSIRFRLDAQDYLALCKNQSVFQQTTWASGLNLVYAVRFGELHSQTLHLQIEQDPQGLRLTLIVSAQAQAAIATLSPTKQGVEDYQPTPSGGLLALILERDVDPRGHSQP